MVRKESNGGDVENVAGAEALQFIERIERLKEEQKGVADDIKEVRAEAKGRGFDVKVIDALVKERAKDPKELHERNAIMDLYRDAIAMHQRNLDKGEVV